MGGTPINLSKEWLTRSNQWPNHIPLWSMDLLKMVKERWSCRELNLGLLATVPVLCNWVTTPTSSHPQIRPGQSVHRQINWSPAHQTAVNMLNILSNQGYRVYIWSGACVHRCGCVCCMCGSQLVTSFLMWCYYLVDTTDRHTYTHTHTHTPHMQYIGDVLSAYAGTPGM